MPHSVTDPSANADLVIGLRELADFIEQHPELPKLRASANCWMNSYDGPGSPVERRAVLGTLAAALGDRATEALRGGDVVIEGAFTGGVDLYARAAVRLLRDAPPEPDYEPIIGARS